MSWLVAGFVYAAAYAAAALALGSHPAARLWAGNLGLLVSPLVPIAIVLRRRRDWRGRELVFWAAIAFGCAIWLAGQIGWALRELAFGEPRPWVAPEIAIQIAGSLMPLLALLARPHRGVHDDRSATAAIDICALTSVAAFLCWSFVVAPGMVPGSAPLALHLLAIVGPAVRVAVVLGLGLAAWRTGSAAWRSAYTRIAIGAGLAIPPLVPLAFSVVDGTYRTGSLLDAGWILPYWCFAWAAAGAPGSAAEAPPEIARVRRVSAPTVLFTALATVPAVGYGLQYAFPLGDPIDHYRGIATAFALTGGLALVMARVLVERRAVGAADRRLRLLASALEQSQDLVVIARGTGIVYVNEAFCAAVGYSRPALETMAGSMLVAEESRSELSRITETAGRGQVARGTIGLKRRDGELLPVGYVVAPLPDPAGGLPCRVAILRDLRDELRAREQKVQSERLSAMGDIVIGVAHELNDPLQSVIGHLDLMMTRPVDAAVRGDLDRVRFEAARAGRILRNLLAFVRKAPQERVLIDLNALVRETVAASLYELTLSGITVDEQYAETLPLVLADRDELRQVVSNLVINAQQSILAAGRPGRVAIRSALVGVDAGLEVRDNGAGVAPDEASRVFEPLFAADASEQSRGLGLAIAFGIATAHGGTLELVPVASGSCFRLTLPGAGFPGPAFAH